VSSGRWVPTRHNAHRPPRSGRRSHISTL
jgi:hypothetical protein